MTGYERITGLMNGGTPDRRPWMPITMMYAADCANLPYREYVSDGKSLAAAQIHFARTFGADHVSVISDPGREAADYGAKLLFFDDQPPAVDESAARLANRADLATLPMLEPEKPQSRCADRLVAVAALAEAVQGEFLIEGWVEGPCAEGADLRGINHLMLDFVDHVAFVRDLFAHCIEGAARFAEAQIAAGADVIGIGDAAASLVGPKRYRELVFPAEKALIERIHAAGARVRLHICGNVTRSLADMAQLGADLVDLDSMVDMAAARKAFGAGGILTGNIDPVRVVKEGDPLSITAALTDCARAAGDRYIIGAGCEIPRGTPPENLHAMRRFVEEVSV